MTAFSIALVASYFYPSLEATLFFLAVSIAAFPDAHIAVTDMAGP